MNNKGAITIFLLLISTIVFCFVGLLIDASRILVATNAVDSAAITAMRSTMGHYDKDLVAEYGLYAIQDTKSQKVSDVFKRYFIANLVTKSTADSTTGFTPLRLVKFDEKDITSSVEMSDPLIRSDVFKREIEDYMKIRGPVMTIMDIIEKLVSQFGKNADKALSDANKAEYENKKGSETKIAVDNLNTKISDFNKDLSENLAPKKIVKLDWVTEFDQSSDNFKSIWENVASSIKSELEKIEKTFIENTSKSIFTLIWSGIDEAADSNYNINQQLDELRSSLNSAKTASNEYAGTLDNVSSNIDNDGIDISKYVDLNYSKPQDIVNDLSAAEIEINNIVTKVESYVKTYEQRVLEANIVDSLIKMSLLKQKEGSVYTEEAFSGDYSLLMAKTSNVAFVNSMPSVTEAMNMQSSKLNSLRNASISNVNSVIDEISSVDLASIRKVVLPKENDNNKQEKEKKKQGVWDSIKTLTDKLETIKGKQRDAGLNRGLFSSISDYKIASSVYAEMETNTDKVDLTFVKKVLNFFKAIADDTAVSMYIMDKCTYLTSGAARDHYFQYGEVEYIFFENDNQFSNIATGVTTLWVMRIAIDSVYYFTKSIILPVSVRAIYALTRGAVQGSLDMVDLIVFDKGCKLWPDAPIDITYEQACFLSVLFKSFCFGYDSVANPLKDTMQATLQYKDKLEGSQAQDIDLKKMNTTLDAKASAKVDLVFLPILGFGLIDSPYFQGGKFIITKTVMSTY